MITPRAVVVTRPTEYEGLLARHGTREQARFFLAGRGQALEAIEERHARRDRALQRCRRPCRCAGAARASTAPI